MRRPVPSLVSVMGVIVVATLVACAGAKDDAVTSSGGTSGGTSGSSGSSGGGTDDDASSSGGLDAGSDAADAAPAGFTLTSPAFAEGGKIPNENACTGANVSPALRWSAGPTGTLSYALVFTDKSNGLVHAVMYDVPGATTSLPANVEKAYQPANVPGAKQTAAYKPTARGYLGPCPGEEHTYELALYAIDVATLPGTTMATTRDQIVPMIMAHDLAVAKLTGTFVKP